MAYSSHKCSSSPYSIEYRVLRFVLSEGLAWCQRREPEWLWVEGAIRRSKGLWIGSDLAFLVGKRKKLSEDSFLLKETHLDTKDCNWKKKKSPKETVGPYWQDDWKQPKQGIKEWKKGKIKCKRGKFWKEERDTACSESSKDSVKGWEERLMLSNPQIRRKRWLKGQCPHKGNQHQPWTSSGRNFWGPVTGFSSVPSFSPWRFN